MHQRLHHVAVLAVDVLRALHVFGPSQPEDLHPDQACQPGKGQAVQSPTEGNRNGHHAHLCRHRFLCMQRLGPGCQYSRGKK